MSRIEAAIARLREAARRVPLLESPYPLHGPHLGPACCEAEIEELEQVVRGSLPSEYREYLATCRRIDAEDVFCGYFLFSPLRIVGGDGSRPRFHVKLRGQLDEVWVVPVGGDGGGNLFVMGTTENASGVVWKWNHEHPVRFDGMAQEGLMQVASSFAEFLERLATDWEHFVGGDRGWAYLAGTEI